MHVRVGSDSVRLWFPRAIDVRLLELWSMRLPDARVVFGEELPDHFVVVAAITEELESPPSRLMVSAFLVDAIAPDVRGKGGRVDFPEIEAGECVPE